MIQHLILLFAPETKQKRLLCSAVLLVIAAAGFGQREPRDSSLPRNYYVSPQGNDNWSGQLATPNGDHSDGPFATLARARAAIRSLKTSDQFNTPVVVRLMGGKYWQHEPLVLEGQDSGTSDKPITYTAYPGDTPILSGARRITGWKPDRDNILQVTLPEVKKGQWRFRELYFNGKRQTRARWPDFNPQDPLYGGWAFVAAALPEDSKSPQAFRYESLPTPPRRWAKPTQAEMSVIPWYCWADDRIPVTQIDLNQRIITLSRPVMPDWMSLMKGNRFYIENAREELDQPGEWSLDTDTGRLYFWPPSGSIAEAEVVAPVTDRLFELRGTPENPIRYVTISGLTLTQTQSTWPEQRHENFHSPLMRGEAIRVEHAEDCRIEDNVIHHVGGDGVRLHGYSARNRVVGNEIAYTGGQGVSLASDSIMNTETWTDRAELLRISALYPRSVQNLISDNYIHHTGTIKKNGGAIHLYAINSVDNVISHNLITDTADKGMTMQDGFGRFLVEANEMRNLALEISDTGAIMTNRWHMLDPDPELGGRIVIRNNLIRDVIGCGAYDKPREGKWTLQTKAGGKIWTPYYTWGIYFDNSGMNRTVVSNIVIGTVLGGVSMPVGDPKDNLFENNILINGSAHGADLRIGGNAATGNRFVRNIVYSTQTEAAMLNVTPHKKQALAECDYNLYFAAGGRALRILGMPDGSLQRWRELGFDVHSEIADPMFINPTAGDFRLKPTSPAFKLGFRPIDIHRIGLLRKRTTPRTVSQSQKDQRP